MPAPAPENPNDVAAGAYVPPYPLRYDSVPPVSSLIRLARRSFLDVWPKSAFSNRISDIRLLRRQIFICNAPESVQEAFVKKHAVYQRKSAQQRHALEPLIGDGLFVSDTDTWSRRRKIVAPIIHASRVPEFAPLMVRTVNEKRAEWQARGAGAPVNALEDMAHLTAEIISRTIFGQQLGHDYGAEIVEGFTAYQRHIDQIDVPSLLGLPEWLPRRRGRALRRARDRILTVLDEIIDRHRSGASEGEASVIGSLLEARDEDGAPLSREAIRNEAAVIFMAGHETTANTLAWAWFLLSQADWARARLHEELDRVLGDRTPTLADVARLPYTRAVIEETLRLYPPVPILAREAMADDTIVGKPVRKGSLVLVVPWLLHRNPGLWDRADHFLPERFLEGGSAAKQSKYAYVPFAIGPRICAGLTFGMTESILSLAILARSFELRLAPGAQVEPVCRLTLRPGDTLPMTLHPRNA